MQPFSLLIKPASAMCNLRCSYCFYLEKSALFSDWKMDEQTLERLVSSFMGLDMPEYVFAWQGGEPTVLGVDFFRRAADFQKKYGRGKTVANALQTNGTLLDREFAEFFAEYRYLLGVSLDGPAHLHDVFRKDAQGEGSHSRVVQGIGHLRRAGVAYNVLTLVSTANVGHGKEVYDYLRAEGHRYLQFIPCVEHAPWGIDGQTWGRFLLDTFDRWLAGDTRHISIRHIDTALNMLAFGHMAACTVSGNCCKYFAVEHDGSIYPCDFYVDPAWRLGCVNDADFSWEKMAMHPDYLAFGKRKAEWGKCAQCPYLLVCAGDCPKHRGFTEGQAQSHLCEGWKMFYARALPELEKLARRLTPDGRLFAERPADRNAPCFCGSGKKRKKCHG